MTDHDEDETCDASDCFIITMRLECLKIAANHSGGNTERLIKEAKTLFKFLIGEFDEEDNDAEETETRNH
jgi:hypothetical protein